MTRIHSLKTTVPANAKGANIISFLNPLIAFVFLCLVPISVLAQVPSTITLTGNVADDQGTALANAVVMVKTGDNLLAHARTLTNAQGNFGQFRNSAHEVADGGQAFLVVRKAGYLPVSRELDSFSGNIGTITLKRDPIENRIDSVMAMMSLAEKIAQMTQPQSDAGHSHSTGNLLFGSVLNGGDGHAPNFLSNMATALNSFPANRARIPVWYGKDAVHGNAGIPGYTVFPHNIGLGATRDSALVRRIGEATAKEMWTAGIDMNFSPAISVALDPRWGRTYESYGENPELHVQMGAAMVRGLQGERFNAPWRVTATAKHFLGDGGTTGGKDRGETSATDDVLRAIHLPGYEAVVEQGVLGVMASFNTIREVHQHVDSVRMTGWLKTELGFDGYIISDWLGIAHSTAPGSTQDYGTPGGPLLTRDAVRNAVNAGIDLAMEPGAGHLNPTHTTFMNFLTELVNSGAVSQARIDDAVRRILRAKYRAGRMDRPGGPSEFMGNTANRASAEHRAIAREAVRKSQVLLKNENSALPLSKNARIHVFGSHRDNIGFQCGGWTLNWQGANGNVATVRWLNNWQGGTYDLRNIGASIYQGMQNVAGTGAALSESSNGMGTGSANADVIVYVTGERPYAEWFGDIPSDSFPSLNFTPSSTDLQTLANHRTAGRKIVTVFVTGRPRIVPELLAASDAFLVAWLPGTEGAGVADILFGDHPIVGKLPITWPGSGNTIQFPYGFGLNYLTTPAAPAAPTLVSKSHNSITLTPNAAYEFSMDRVKWQSSNEFTDLTPDTEYTFYQRVAATNASNASVSSAGFIVKTDISASIAGRNREIPFIPEINPDSGLWQSAVVINEFTAGPNPVAKSLGKVDFFWQGGEIRNCQLRIYGASGDFIKKIEITDPLKNGLRLPAANKNSRRVVGKWDFTDSKGRSVSEGSYIVKGTITAKDGKREKVSLILGVR